MSKLFSAVIAGLAAAAGTYICIRAYKGYYGPATKAVDAEATPETTKVALSPEGKALAKKFCNAYVNTPAAVGYEGRWANNTGYFDGALDDAELLAVTAEGPATTCDPAQRRIIFFRGEHGVEVLFQRYTGTPVPLVHQFRDERGCLKTETDYDHVTAVIDRINELSSAAQPV